MTPRAEASFVGIDGCRGGWIAVTWRSVGTTAQVGPHLVDVLPCFAATSPSASAFDSASASASALRVVSGGSAGRRFAPAYGLAVAIDMPIGILGAPSPGGRACDREARAMLGPRGRSVFSPPSRAALAATRFADARGISLQCWNLVPRIRELDALMTPALQARVVEAHPELAFAQMAGAPMRHRKRTREGAAERRRWLRREGVAIPERPQGAAEDDLLDACALAWTARRVAEGRALRLPVAPPVDARGLRMEIWA